MKKIVVFISFFLASLAGFSQIKDGFARSESGVWYKIETKNPKGRAVVEGDIVIGNYAVAYGDSLVFSSLGTPAQPTFGAMEANKRVSNIPLPFRMIPLQRCNNCLRFSKRATLLTIPSK